MEINPSPFPTIKSIGRHLTGIILDRYVLLVIVFLLITDLDAPESIRVNREDLSDNIDLTMFLVSSWIVHFS